MTRGPEVDPRPQLLAYPNSLGGSMGAIADLLEGPLEGLFRGVHILPPFPSSADRGFAPLTYREIDPAFGGWEDIERISRHHDVLLDVMGLHDDDEEGAANQRDTRAGARPQTSGLSSTSR